VDAAVAIREGPIGGSQNIQVQTILSGVNLITWTSQDHGSCGLRTSEHELCLCNAAGTAADTKNHRRGLQFLVAG
jgi:hypothetical protein